MLHSLTHKRVLSTCIYISLSAILLLTGCNGTVPESTVSEATGEEVIASPADFTVSNLQIVPQETKIRDSVGISVLVANKGGETGTYTVELKINGSTVSSKAITLAGGSSGTVSFKNSQETDGIYTVTIGSLSGEFIVIPPPSAPGGTQPGGSEPPPASGINSDWVIAEGSGTNYRAVHMGGNWGINVNNVKTLPEEYFEYLRDLNVNWVGISVALHIDGSMDSTVELQYSNVPIPTFDDATLRSLIKAFRKHGFNVYIHTAFEGGNTGLHPVSRWQLGDPLMHEENPNISPEFWPWRTDHPQHQAFVAQFWQTYTDCLVHIAKIAEEEGVGLLTIGTETDRLFRSRSGGRWTNNFLPQMQTMVSSIRAVYHSLLSYEMHCNAVTSEFYDAGSDYLFKDLGLDFIAVSAYFQMTPNVPSSPPSVLDLESRWNAIFNEYLKPLRERNDNKPIVFTEFGYVDSLAAMQNAAVDEFTAKVLIDGNGNGQDDGEEAQANAFAAMLNTMDKYPGTVKGAFMWDVNMCTGMDYRQGPGKQRTFNLRLKLAEAIVRNKYAGWR